MSMKQITLTITEEGKLQTDYSGEPGLSEVISIYFTAMLGAMESVVRNMEAAGFEEVDKARGEIYDMVNCGAANILDLFMPAPTNAADQLTAEAILKAENEVLEAHDNITPFPTAPTEADDD